MSIIETLIKLDTNLFIFLNGIHSPFWDEVMWIISGKYIWIILYVFILYIFIKKYKIKSIPIIIAVIITIVFSDQISNNIFKDGFQRLRPSHNIQLAGIIHIVKDYYGGQFGFISSHACNTFAFATFISLFFKNKYITISILLWATVVSYSRIYLGVHYPADIICGALVGGGIASAVYFIYMKVINKYEKNHINS